MDAPRLMLFGGRRWLALSLLAVAGTGIAGAAGPPLDACALLTAADVERVQGGSFREAIPSGNAAGVVATTQCFFRVDRFSSSVSLTLTRGDRGADRGADRGDRADRSGAAQREVRERWQRLLHPQERRGPNAKSERDRDGENEGTMAALTPVAGLGEEAFLTGGRGNVTLYVLTQGAYLRISVGGPGDAADWARQAQALARAALERLQARPPRHPAAH
jgi:hypothetical protein